MTSASWMRRLRPARRPTGTAAAGDARVRTLNSLLRAEHRQERLLRHFDSAQLLHARLALLLLLQQLLLPRDVATVALGKDVLAEGFHCRSRQDLAPDGRLHRDSEHLPGDDGGHAVDDSPTDVVSLVAVGDGRQRVDLLVVDEDVDLHNVTVAVLDELVVHRGVAARE